MWIPPKSQNNISNSEHILEPYKNIWEPKLESEYNNNK